jgi:hypothetical protein
VLKIRAASHEGLNIEAVEGSMIGKNKNQFGGTC